MSSTAGSEETPADRGEPRQYCHRIVVLASGRGSNFQALLDAGLAPAICGLICDQPEAPVLERARTAHIPALLIRRRKTETRGEYCVRLADAAEGLFAAGSAGSPGGAAPAADRASFGGPASAASSGCIFLLGWMRLLSNSFLSRFPNRVINLHPALPGTFPGLEAIEREYDAYRAGSLKTTGIMVHYVPDEGMDSGPVIATAEVPIFPDDSPASFEARVHETEHRLVIDTAQKLVKGVLPPPQSVRSTSRSDASDLPSP